MNLVSSLFSKSTNISGYYILQVDLIDMQSQRDGEYRFILNYQDHLTKFVCLRPLKTKTAEEVAYHLVDIFCDKGAPHILQYDDGRKFSNKVYWDVLGYGADENSIVITSTIVKES